MLKVSASSLRSHRFIDTRELMPAGPARAGFRPVQPLFERAFGFTGLWKLHRDLVRPGDDAPTLARKALAKMGIETRLNPDDISRLREVDGPLLVMSNHPLGGWEFFALVELLEAIRPGGWKFLGNQLLCALAPLQPHLIPLDPISTGSGAKTLNRRGLAEAMRHLRGGGVIGLFPSGRVSGVQSADAGLVVDRPWTEHGLRLAKAAAASVACIHINGANSAFFQRLSPAHPRLRALFLTREFLKPQVKLLQPCLASWRSASEVGQLARDSAQGMAVLRAECYARADQSLPPAENKQSEMQPAIEPLAPLPEAEAIEGELKHGEMRSSFLLKRGPFDVHLFRGETAPTALRALGIVREHTFRQAGQGTGKAVDLAEEDAYYHHLVLWDREQRCLAGAYRIGKVQQIISERGASGIYLDHVFKIEAEFWKELGAAFELSRSFVDPAYQRDNQALSALWAGLAKATELHRIDRLFGSVTISNAHHPASRAILVEFLKNNYADSDGLEKRVKARHPFVPRSRYHALIARAYAGQPIGKLSPMIERIEDGQRGIPPLMRYYCNLGARFLAYHVEPSFQDALYCLLRVEMRNIPPALLRRLCGN